jgi:hypothetical protein
VLSEPPLNQHRLAHNAPELLVERDDICRERLRDGALDQEHCTGLDGWRYLAWQLLE